MIGCPTHGYQFMEAVCTKCRNTANVYQERDNIAALNSSLIAELAAKDARIAELEDHAVLATLAKNNDALRARIAELADKGTLQALRDANARAERAEAAAACYAGEVGSAGAENANLRDAVKRAEAELKAMREALEPILMYYCDYLDNDEAGDPNTNRHVARARTALRLA